MLSANDTTTILETSDYLNTLLRDPTSSHLLETIVSRSPDNAFVALWSTYFQGKLARLALHPVANFVLAKALERVSAGQLSAACGELEGNWGKMISMWFTFPCSQLVSTLHRIIKDRSTTGYY
jgi:nucleolar protein 9